MIVKPKFTESVNGSGTKIVLSTPKKKTIWKIHVVDQVHSTSHRILIYFIINTYIYDVIKIIKNFAENPDLYFLV